ncbi:hypothetical protein ACODT3_42975 [Streptomyces sp. 4.24]|uniref:hypothetical protein n=1 Tax=Streptomyces tritrimontium TaxID=3406573 RepID=UPI003BB717BB
MPNRPLEQSRFVPLIAPQSNPPVHYPRPMIARAVFQEPVFAAGLPTSDWDDTAES